MYLILLLAHAVWSCPPPPPPPLPFLPSFACFVFQDHLQGQATHHKHHATMHHTHHAHAAGPGVGGRAPSPHARAPLYSIKTGGRRAVLRLTTNRYADRAMTTFSNFNEVSDLTRSFGNGYVLCPSCPPSLPATVTHELVRAGMTDRRKPTLVFFVEGNATTEEKRSHHVQGPHGRIFDFLALNSGKGLFHLTIVPHRQYNVCVATTGGPQWDWCGYPRDGDSPVGGVVDMLITYPPTNEEQGSRAGNPRVVGEIKPKPSGGVWQLVAAMQTDAILRHEWPLGKSLQKCMYRCRKLEGVKYRDCLVSYCNLLCACAARVTVVVCVSICPFHDISCH